VPTSADSNAPMAVVRPTRLAAPNRTQSCRADSAVIEIGADLRSSVTQDHGRAWRGLRDRSRSRTLALDFGKSAP
jgi:hypothetical protein